jgi:hypothetical protein
MSIPPWKLPAEILLMNNVLIEEELGNCLASTPLDRGDSLIAVTVRRRELVDMGHYRALLANVTF